MDNTVNRPVHERQIRQKLDLQYLVYTAMAYANIDKVEIFHALGPRYEDMIKLHC